jgi:hypothetical protein
MIFLFSSRGLAGSLKEVEKINSRLSGEDGIRFWKGS